jgi:hypothetical protein
MQRSLLCLFLFFGSVAFAQIPCDKGFRTDTSIINRFTYAKEEVELMEVTIKNNYQLQFIRSKDKKTYLRIIVRDNLGFGQIGEFMLICGKKQIYDKDVKLVPIDKSSGWFILELNPNYIQTLRDLGLTKIIFRDTVEFLIPKADSEKIKQTAACFFDAVVPKE